MCIQLTDDGTLDTVLRCSDCGETFRFNYATSMEDAETPCEHGADDGCEACYDAFVDDCIADAESDHDC